MKIVNSRTHCDVDIQVKEVTSLSKHDGYPLVMINIAIELLRITMLLMGTFTISMVIFNSGLLSWVDNLFPQLPNFDMRGGFSRFQVRFDWLSLPASGKNSSFFIQRLAGQSIDDFPIEMTTWLVVTGT